MQQISVTELRAMLDAPAPPLLLDVREPWEVALASINPPGVDTLAVPMGQIPAALARLEPARPVVCYCHHGMRSLQVVAFLERQGFETVYNLAGGIEAWSCEQDPMVPRY